MLRKQIQQKNKTTTTTKNKETKKQKTTNKKTTTTTSIPQLKIKYFSNAVCSQEFRNVQQIAKVTDMKSCLRRTGPELKR